MGFSSVIIDGDNVCKRTCMATARTDLKAGLWNGGIYGAVSMIATALDSPDYDVGNVYAVFDDGIPEWRLKLLPTYKSARQARPDKYLTPEQKRECYRQVGQTREMLEAFGVTCVSYPRHEADDVIAALARELGETHGKSRPIVVSNDKDLWQLLDPELGGVWIYDVGTGKLREFDDLEADIGVDPREYLVYKVLCGDSSDGVPGAAGVAKGRAQALIAETGGQLRGCRRSDRLDGFLDWLREHEKSLAKIPKYVASILSSVDALKKAERVVDLVDTFNYTRYGHSLRALAKRRGELNTRKVMTLCARHKLGYGSDAMARMVRVMRRIAG